MRSSQKSIEEVLTGKRPIKMAVTDFPISQDAVDAQVRLQGRLSDALCESGALRVKVVEDSGPGNDDDAKVG
ncbi:hypothetical protein P3W24_18350 [Luteibacter sp. PPL201]|uniref:Uncharacterized protein n=1 Tax=Luteibacter sahnii TaxID=3021977 RepID=A0ABT6BFM7_9GAMM